MKENFNVKHHYVANTVCMCEKTMFLSLKQITSKTVFIKWKMRAEIITQTYSFINHKIEKIYFSLTAALLRQTAAECIEKLEKNLAFQMLLAEVHCICHCTRWQYRHYRNGSTGYFYQKCGYIFQCNRRFSSIAANIGELNWSRHLQ